MNLDRVARHAYALCLLLAAVTLGLAPLHQLGVHRANVHQLHADDRITVLAASAPLAVGERLPLYRFNPGWMQPIGHASVEEVTSDRIVARLDRPTFHWPPGPQGTVVSHQDDKVRINVGEEVGYEVGKPLRLFDGRHQIAKATITATGVGHSEARLDTSMAGLDLVGTSATNYQVIDQVAWFHAPVLAAFEVVIIAVALLLWAWSVVSPRPGHWAAGMGAHLRAVWPRGTAARVGMQAVLGVPIVWLGGKVLWYSITWITHRVTTQLYLLDLLPDLDLQRFNEAGVPVLWVLGAAGWIGWLATRRTSPALALWRALRWRRRASPAWLPRWVLLWGLHLLIVYAFASTLLGFLQGNLNSLGALLPLTDLEEFYQAARLTLWSVTICGCLYGYGHTVLSILWTRRALRHLDFTLSGWFTNAICYFPLLGAAWSHAFPELHGSDPIFVQGPLAHLQPVTLLLLNLCYTLSIWNLGKMFGVMADKGVRTSGFYSVVRHPSYTLEALMFMVMYLAGASTWLQWVAAIAFLLKYWLRSEREDHFMHAANEDYQPYAKRVIWKFVPGIY